MKKFFLLMMVQIICGNAYGQSIFEKYDFKVRQNFELLYYDGIKLALDPLPAAKKYKRRSIYLFSFQANHKKDSTVLPEGIESTWIADKDIVDNDDEIYFFAYRPPRLIKVKKATGKLSTQLIFDPDSFKVYAVVKSGFIYRDGYSVGHLEPVTKNTKTLFDFVENADDRFKDDIGTEHPVGVGGIFSFTSADKILIKTGYNESDASFDCVYYIVDISTGQIEKLPFSHFESLISEPRENLKRLPILSLDTFSIDIDKMYFDASDSVGYLTCRFLYEEKISPTNSKSRTYQQDAFVVDRNYNLIGRALERQIWIEYPIYERGKKIWNVISSETDSSKRCSFKINLKYGLEKAFYDIYHDSKLTPQSIHAFDKYELSLLKNFIFAKHNYGFNNPFYQGYFNTFVFYGDEGKQKARIKNVDRLLTATDRSNLDLLQKALR